MKRRIRAGSDLGIFGALLDRLVIGIRQLPDTRLANPPRMADFAIPAVACGLDDFETAYRASRIRQRD